MHTTGGSFTNYVQYQEPAQHWICGFMNSEEVGNYNPGTLWTALGDPYTYGNYQVTNDEFEAVGQISGDWLYYEAEMTPYQFFSGRWNLNNPASQQTSVVSPLAENQNINLGVTITANDGGSVGYDSIPGYRGMASETTVNAGWWEYWNYVLQRTLIRTGVTGTITLQGFSGSTLGATATIVITNASNASETHNLVLDGSGVYSFNTALTGACTAVASDPGYTPQSVPVTVTSNSGNASFILSPAILYTSASINVAKNDALGSDVSLTGSITAVFADYIYIESDNRVSGIRVDTDTSASGLTNTDVGEIVTVDGTVQQDSAAQEIYIQAASITPTGQTYTIQPLGLTNKSAGGGSAVGSGGNGQVGVAGGTGLNNIGLLVRTTGLASAGQCQRIHYQ